MPQIYCGNNAQDQRLLAGAVAQGTPYTCLRKGIGVGRRLPYDQSYEGAYMPIDQRRIYCGNKAVAPAGYDRIGNLSHCLQKGVGVGKRQRVEAGPPPLMIFVRHILPFLLFILISVGVFLLLYFQKPEIVTKERSDSSREIDWRKFMILFLPTALTIALSIFILWKMVILRRY
jgi:hypothetical protein